MHAYRRPQVDEVTRLLTREAKPLIIAVVGPRQTGKTTVIRQVLEQVNMPGRYLAVDEVAVEPNSRWGDGGPRGGGAWLHDVWREARRDAEQGERGFVLALDEIQHVDGWSLIAKAQWDRDRRNGCPLRVIVAGSAPWSMMTGLHESLAGRFMPVNVGHWSYAEMSEAFGFTLDQYLFFGGYPGMADEIGDPRTWRSTVQRTIISPAIEKDIVALSRIEKPALMRRLMTLAAHYSGQILSYNKMLGQLQEAGNVTTLSDYLNLLSEASLVTGLPKYSGAPHVALGSSPKLNVLNTALMTAQLRRSFEETRADRTLWGRIVESAVGAHLHNTAGFEVDLYHWREARHEVDFVLSRGLEPIGIEVKSGGRAGHRHGREAFERRFPGARTLLVGDRGVPIREFLSQPARYWADDDGSSGGSVREPAQEYAGRIRTETWTQPLVAGWKESGDSVAEARQREFMAEAREQRAQLERGEGSPWLWHRIGRAYMCAIPGHFGDAPLECLGAQLESDTRLLDAVLRGLPRFVHRSDIPSLGEMVRTDRAERGDHYSYPVLASLAEALRRGGDPLRDLDEAGITRAVGARHLARFVKEPTWYRRAIQRCPHLSADALVTVYRSLIRARSERSGHLASLFDDDKYDDVARLVVPALLGTFPTRCTKIQISALRSLLWAGLLHVHEAELADRIRRRIAARGMDAAQRALWLAAGLLIAADEHRPEAVAFVLTGREPRARHILGFLVPDRPRGRDLPQPWDDWATSDIVALFKAFARWNDPWPDASGRHRDATTLPLRTDWLLKRWLGIVADRIELEGEDALLSLARLPALHRWHDEIEELRFKTSWPPRHGC